MPAHSPLYIELRNLLGDRARQNEPMSRHTTFRIGGPADLFAVVDTVEELQAASRLCRGQGVPVKLLGGGANLLVLDQGIRGCVIKLGKTFRETRWEGDAAVCGAADFPVRIARQAAERGLEGMEWGAGIPGTLGGAVVMNAGTNLGSLKDVLVEVSMLMPDGEVATVPADQLGLGYRRSNLQGRDDIVVLTARVQLRPGEPDEIRRRIDEHLAYRNARQPIHLPNAGSIFKNPRGDFAGRLIEQVGLKGARVGDAQFSELHANFIVNLGHATAADVLELIARAKARVAERFGIALEEEVRIWG